MAGPKPPRAKIDLKATADAVARFTARRAASTPHALTQYDLQRLVDPRVNEMFQEEANRIYKDALWQSYLEASQPIRVANPSDPFWQRRAGTSRARWDSMKPSGFP